MKFINIFLASENSFIPSKGTEKSKKLGETLDTMKIKIAEMGWNNEVRITPWWDDRHFTKHGNTLDSVMNIAHEYDIGVFVFGRDKELKENKDGKMQYAPNSNVLIELGMFMALGKKICIIKEEDVIIPSDINNENANLLGLRDRCVDGLIGTIQAIKEENSESKVYDKACVYYDIELSRKIVGFSKNNSVIKDWKTKSLYVGSKSAYLWGEIEGNDNYVEANVIQDFMQQFGDWMSKLPIDNVVSFGPGIGKIDQELMRWMRECYYIPVDLNVSLAIQSIKNVEANAKGIPFAIIDDFELDSCFSRLRSFLESKRQEIGKNNLFSMLGVTFSNLPKTENAFLQKMNSLMRDANDYFLLDAIIYQEENDEDLKDRIRRQVSDEHYLNLLKNAINKKKIGKNETPLQHLKIEDLTVELIIPRKIKKTYTNLLRTKVVYVGYEGNILLIAKQYQYEELKRHLIRDFKIVRTHNDAEDNRGVFLLKKKSVTGKSKKVLKRIGTRIPNISVHGKV